MRSLILISFSNLLIIQQLLFCLLPLVSVMAHLVELHKLPDVQAEEEATDGDAEASDYVPPGNWSRAELAVVPQRSITRPSALSDSSLSACITSSFNILCLATTSFTTLMFDGRPSPTLLFVAIWSGNEKFSLNPEYNTTIQNHCTCVAQMQLKPKDWTSSIQLHILKITQLGVPSLCCTNPGLKCFYLATNVRWFGSSWRMEKALHSSAGE